MSDPDPETAVATVDAAPPLNPLALIQQAVAARLGADELAKLVALRDHMAATEARAAYQRAMMACQRAMPVIVRDKVNQRTRSRYVSLDAINAVARPVYAAHGFYVSFTEEPATRPNWVRTVATVGHTAGHRETAFLELPCDGVGPKGEPIGGMNAVQGVCSTTTYAMRRLLCLVFNITIADEDTDGNGPAQASPADAAEVRRLLPADPGKFWAWVSEVHQADVRRPEDIHPAHMPTVLAMLRRKGATK